MKAVPKVNTVGLYIEDTIVDDAYSGVVPFYADPPEPEQPPGNEIELADEQQEEEPEIVGYIVGVPVPQGLFKPRFNLAAWEAREEGDTSDQSYWVEGLTAEEIEALHPPTVPTELEQLRAEIEEIRHENIQLRDEINSAAEGLSELKSVGTDQEDSIHTLGSESIAQELNTFELKQQNNLLGSEMIGHDLLIVDLQKQVETLGQMVITLELKIMANKEGEDDNVSV